MVMPLSRYWSGDFSTPTMEAHWGLGEPYRRVGPTGVFEVPPGMSLGGSESSAKRRELVRSIPERMRSLGIGIQSLPWNESDDAPPLVLRLDTTSQGAFIADVERNIV